MNEKQHKEAFRKETQNNPQKYYATKFLEKEGFQRQKCKKTQIYFWSTQKRDYCGDAAIEKGFDFFENNPSQKNYSYSEVWSEFKQHMNQRGYSDIKRYSVVARWRDDTDFVQASIYNFQPYVVSGQVKPPKNPLVVPQFSLRFNDIDNVGRTMSHFTGFVMIGQHTFVNEDDWNQEKYFKDLYEFFTLNLKISKHELILHEDIWAGGGNMGPCMEIFCRGMELANQVYMLYDITDGKKDLKIKVLDMGMGHERVTWFSQGKSTAYDAVFPAVMKKLYERVGVSPNPDVIKDYLPYASYLNTDEVEDMQKAWERVGEKTGISVDVLKKELEPLRQLYSVAEHCRSLLVSINDGALPSNVKGGYNLRVILRRAQRFIWENNWDLELKEVCEWHAKELKEVFPELGENLAHVKKILDVEKQKYEETQSKNKKLISRLVDEKKISLDKLLELYDSHGISPEDILFEYKKRGEKPSFKVPENFYSLVSQRHEDKKEEEKKIIFEVEDEPDTTALYYDHYDYVDFKGKVLKILTKEGFHYVLLHKTAFYPTSGGQEHDVGLLEDVKVIDVIKQGAKILHKLETKPSFKVGDVVSGKVDFDRRLQLTQHHSATHLITGSVRDILGSHVWQAGASKTLEKGRLDITHYENLTEEELENIERKANEAISLNLPIYKEFMSRDKAEALYGVRIYQGGAVPGKTIRIVNIEGFDVEACGGTHLDVTGDVDHIKIIKTSKIQDGVVRIEFVAGKAAKKIMIENKQMLQEIKMLLSCKENQIPARTTELFSKWKKVKKGKLKEFNLVSTETSSGDVLKQAADNLKTQPQHLVKTIKRFLKDIENKL